MTDIADSLQQHVAAAIGDKTPLHIIGGGSKQFLGRHVDGQALPVGGHRGIISYEPTELVITARAGTPLDKINDTLTEQQQMLPFEPPQFGDGATLGGTIACGLSGPRRPYTGSARDFVLGCRMINGKGEILHFGGEVMKNVAGYDAARLMTGAFGTLGVLLDISLKVLPRPEAEITLIQECTATEAIASMNAYAGRPLPLSATCFNEGRLYVRLSGTHSAVNPSINKLGGETLADSTTFWRDLREQTLPFFASSARLWRVSVPSSSPPLVLPGHWLLEWGGAQRWLISDADPEHVRQSATNAGGHATLFRNGNRRSEIFQPLAPGLLRLHHKLKQAFDPLGLFNPGRMYPGL